MKFEFFPQCLYQKCIKTLHLEVVLYIFLTSFILFLGEDFNMCIVNIRNVYATNKNKLTLIIWPPTVYSKINTLGARILKTSQNVGIIWNNSEC